MQYFNVKSHVDVKFPYVADALSELTLEMRLSFYSLVYPFYSVAAKRPTSEIFQAQFLTPML
jgi:hypothetical protein